MRAGFKTDETPLDIAFDEPPEAIARWFAEIPLIDDRTAQMIAPEYIIELEVLSRAVDFRGASLQNPYAARP